MRPVGTLAELQTEALACTRCALATGRTQVVFGVGDPAASLMFVGEGPGREEDLAGEPFVGRSGKLLDKLLHQEIGLERTPVLHRQRREVPAPGEPRPAARRDRLVPPLPRSPDRADRPPRRGHAGELRHPAAARHDRGHPPAARPGLPVPRRPPRPHLPPGRRACAVAPRSWPRCVPTSSGPSCSWPATSREPDRRGPRPGAAPDPVGRRHPGPRCGAGHGPATR